MRVTEQTTGSVLTATTPPPVDRLVDPCLKTSGSWCLKGRIDGVVDASVGHRIIGNRRFEGDLPTAATGLR
jgi:hypothetical protein